MDQSEYLSELTALLTWSEELERSKPTYEDLDDALVDVDIGKPFTKRPVNVFDERQKRINDVVKDLLIRAHKLSQPSLAQAVVDAATESQRFSWCENICWLAPTSSAMKQLAQMITSNIKSDVVYSIGCGTGFFEWLLQQHDLKIFGVESQEQFTQDSYQFLNMYHDNDSNDDDNNDNDDSNSAKQIQTLGVPPFVDMKLLLFVFAHKEHVLDKYIRRANAKYIIIVGDAICPERAVSPRALEENDDWKKIDECKVDGIWGAVFVRKSEK